MADTSKPKEVHAEQEGTTSAQGATQKDHASQEEGAVRGAEVQTVPNHNDKRSDNKQDPYEHLRTMVMGLTLVVTICTLVATVFASCSAKRSADANVATTRAWIILESWTIPIMKDGRQFAMALTLKNVGRTPADKILTTYDVHFSEGPPPQVPKVTGCPTKQVESLGVAIPERKWGNGIEGEVLTDDQVRMLENQTAHFSIHFCTKYRDVIVPGEERLTEGVYFWPNKGRKNELGIYGQHSRMK